jgi:hypothetical protein
MEDHWVRLVEGWDGRFGIGEGSAGGRTGRAEVIGPGRNPVVLPLVGDLYRGRL